VFKKDENFCNFYVNEAIPYLDISASSDKIRQVGGTDAALAHRVVHHEVEVDSATGNYVKSHTCKQICNCANTYSRVIHKLSQFYCNFQITAMISFLHEAYALELLWYPRACCGVKVRYLNIDRIWRLHQLKGFELNIGNEILRLVSCAGSDHVATVLETFDFPAIDTILVRIVNLIRHYLLIQVMMIC